MMPMDEPEVMLARIADALGVPASAFRDRSADRLGDASYRDLDEAIGLWLAITSPTDRRTVLALLRQIIDRQMPD